MSGDHDEELGALYAGPLESFVDRRKALAQRLRKEGARAEAARIGKLAKPSVSLWATNQLAHRAPHALTAYLEAHHRARARQLRALADGDPESKDLAATAARHERRLLEAAVTTAAALLAEAGRSAGRATLDRVGTNLRAAVVEVDRQAALERGTLNADLEEPGFAVLAAGMDRDRPEWLEAEIARLAGLRGDSREIPQEPEPPVDVPSSEDLAAAARRAEAERQRAQREREKDQARQREEEAMKALAQRERAEAEAERIHAARTRDLERARVEVVRAEAALEAARTRARETEAQLSVAEEDLGRAQGAREAAARIRDDASEGARNAEAALAELPRADPSP